GSQLPAGVCRAVGSAGGYRAVGWPQARAEAAKSEGSRLAAAEELISRERNVGFAGEECWFRGRELLVSRAATNIHLPQNRADAHTPALRSTSHPKNPRRHPVAQPRSALRASTLPRNRTAPSARVLV